MWDCCTTALVFRVSFTVSKLFPADEWPFRRLCLISTGRGNANSAELKMDIGATEFPPVYAHWLTPHYKLILCCSVSTVSNVSSAVLTTKCQIKIEGQHNKLPYVWLKLMMCCSVEFASTKFSRIQKGEGSLGSKLLVHYVGRSLVDVITSLKLDALNFAGPFLRANNTVAQSRHNGTKVCKQFPTSVVVELKLAPWWRVKHQHDDVLRQKR